MYSVPQSVNLNMVQLSLDKLFNWRVTWSRVAISGCHSGGLGFKSQRGLDFSISTSNFKEHFI